MGEAIKFGRGKLVTLNPVFSENSWEDIIAAVQSGKAPEAWKVGDQKAMKINGTDYLVDIIGKNHDDYADGSGKAPFTFQLHDCYQSIAYMTTTGTNNGGWTDSWMRKTNLPTLLASMPSEAQAAVREVSKRTSRGSQSSTINTTADKLFLLSEIEAFGRVIDSASGEGSQYEYYAAGNSRVKKHNGTTKIWWTRSPYVWNSSYFIYVSGTGSQGFNTANTSCSVAFAFCF